MGTTSALRHLLKSLCDNTHWKYAVFWKLRHQSHMVLTWEDGYFDHEKPGGFLNVEPQTLSFGYEMDTTSNSPGCPVATAVGHMSYCSYSLGEGVVGEVASRRKHLWTFFSEYDLQPQACLQFPEEWQLQFEGGIKTILLVPVIPLGVVQLGSFYTVLEDLSEIIRIRDIFRTIQHDVGTFVSSSPRMDPSDPFLPFNLPSVVNLSSTSVNRDSVHSQISQKKVPVTSGFGVMSHLLPTSMPQDDLPLPADIIDQILGVNTSPYIEGSVWKPTCSNLLVNDIGGPHMPNQSGGIGDTVGGDLAIFSCLEEKLSVNSFINHGWTSEQSILSDPYMKERESKEYDQGFEKEINEEANAIIDDRCLSFPFDSEVNEAPGLASLEKHDDPVWNTFLTRVDEWSSSSSLCQMEMPKVYSPTFEEAHTGFANGETEQLLDAVITELLNDSDDSKSALSKCLRSCSNSLCKFTDACLTQCKTQDAAWGLEDSLSWSHKRSTDALKNEGLLGSPARSSEKSTLSTPSVQAQQGMARGGVQKRGPKSSKNNKTRGNTGDIHKSKPRDRQLIQDRMKELRELIPNGSKCSIDALLDRTIKHMMFLQSIPCQVEKLRNSARPKAKGEDFNQSADPICNNGASWVYELGYQYPICPLTVESLDQPGKILIEMQCKEYGLFLDIAQVIKRLQLSILKGIMETRSEVLWAHFIVETPKGFHRMDILWPLVQLLQQNNTPIPALL